MKRSIRWIIRENEYKPLFMLANELAKSNWKETLTFLSASQLFDILGFDAHGGSPLPKIDGEKANFARARALQSDIRNRLKAIANLSAASESNAPVSTWCKALILPTGEKFFEDAGEGFRFLAERLEYEVRRDDSPKLHLRLCDCGCDKFFTWAGDWARKQRRFLNEEHRMRYHNQQNLENKRLFAKRKRAEGNPKYF